MSGTPFTFGVLDEHPGGLLLVAVHDRGPGAARRIAELVGVLDAADGCSPAATALAARLGDGTDLDAVPADAATREALVYVERRARRAAGQREPREVLA